MLLGIQREINVYSLYNLIQIKDAACSLLLSSQQSLSSAFCFFCWNHRNQDWKAGLPMWALPHPHSSLEGSRAFSFLSLWLLSPSVYLFLSLPLSLLLPLFHIQHSVIIGQCESMKNETGMIAALMELIDQRKKYKVLQLHDGWLLQAATQKISQAVWIERERRTLRKHRGSFT